MCICACVCQSVYRSYCSQQPTFNSIFTQKNLISKTHSIHNCLNQEMCKLSSLCIYNFIVTLGRVKISLLILCLTYLCYRSHILLMSSRVSLESDLGPLSNQVRLTIQYAPVFCFCFAFTLAIFNLY